MTYDRSKMQHKEKILRFQWGDYKAIGIKHFEDRRDERTKNDKTDIFDCIGLTDEDVLLKCFQILKEGKYQEILNIIEKNKPSHTEFIAAFETDEMTDKTSQFYYVFVVFSISIKETAMNGIEQGEEFLSCITVVKDTYKKRHRLPANTIEHTFCYHRGEGGGDDYYWKTIIPR
jgi:hypothetical protein